MGRQPFPFTLYRRDNGMWYYSINRTSGVPAALCERRLSTGEQEEGRARRFVQKRIRELIETSVRSTGQTFGAYAMQFYTEGCPHCMRVRRVSPETMRDRRSALLRHIRGSALARLPLEEVRTVDLALFRGQLFVKKLKSSSVRKVMDIVRVILREATINRLIPYDPAAALPRVANDYSEAGVFTIEELRKMFAERPGAWFTDDAWCIFRIAAVLGLRSSEVRALTSRDVDGDVLHVTKALKRDKRLGLPKWDICRDAPVPPFLQVELAHYKQHPPDTLLTFRLKSMGWWAKRFAVAMEALGIPVEDDRGCRRRPHSLRHTIMTQLIAHGVPGPVVGTFLGHDTGLTAVQKKYLHLGPAEMQSVTAALERIFSL